MEQVFLVIAATYAVSLGAGLLLEKYLRMPWMFAALFFGMVLSSRARGLSRYGDELAL